MPSANTSAPAPAVAPAYFGRREAAEFLGISIPCLDVWVRNGICPAPLKIGKKVVRWNPRELRVWLDCGAPKRDDWLKIRDAELGRARI